MQVWGIRCYLDNAPLAFLDGELTFEQTYEGNAVVMQEKVKMEYYKYRDLRSQVMDKGREQTESGGESDK